jgi:stage II sporulation protein E
MTGWTVYRMSKNGFVESNIGSLVTARLESKSGHTVLNAVVSFGAGVLFSRAEIFGSFTPFGVAAVAAAPAGDTFFVLLGVIFGYLLPFGGDFSAKYIAAALAVFVMGLILSNFKNVASHPITAPLTASIASLVTGMAVVINNGMQPYDIVICLAETLICGCAVMFLQVAVPLLRNPSKMWALEQQQLICVTISFCILLLSISKINMQGISLAHIVGVLAVLIASRYGKEAGGSITGVAVGIILGFEDKNMIPILANYGFGGLIAGVFAPLGRFGCAVAFVLANTVAGLYLGSAGNIITGLYEVMIATVIFMILPEKLMCKFSVLFVPAQGDMSVEKLKSAVSTRLVSVADALEEVSHTVSQVTQKLHNINNDDISAVFHNAAEQTCKRCGTKMICWETAYNGTMGVLNDMTEQLKSEHQLVPNDVPKHFAARCSKLNELLNSINTCYAEYGARKFEQHKSAQLRTVLAEQFGGVSNLLKDMATEFSAFTRSDFCSTDRVRAAFASCGLETGESFCRTDSMGRMTLEAEIKPGNSRVSRNDLMSELSTACGRVLGPPEITNDGNLIHLRFYQKPEFTVKFGQAFFQKDGERLCGDAFDTFLDGNGHAIMILSDGMGCGGRAAVDSNLTIELMSKLLRSGFGYDNATSIVNSAMMLKSGEESFATLDIVTIDIYSGEAGFLKAGAPPTYIRRCGRVECISQNSLPVGIIKGIQLEKDIVNLRKGDLIVMISDGVLNGDESWLIKEIEEYCGENLRIFAQSIAKKAKEFCKDEHDDDITVLVAKLEENS